MRRPTITLLITDPSGNIHTEVKIPAPMRKGPSGMPELDLPALARFMWRIRELIEEAAHDIE